MSFCKAALRHRAVGLGVLLNLMVADFHTVIIQFCDHDHICCKAFLVGSGKGVGFPKSLEKLGAQDLGTIPLKLN